MKGLFIFNATAKPNKNPLDSTPAIASNSIFFKLSIKQSTIKFEIDGFSFGPNAQDEMRDRLTKGVDKFLDVSKLPNSEVAQLARDLEIDIAIDLKGYTEDSRTEIFAYRCAPIQVNYLGYPGTMGVDYMDYVIADPIVISESNVDSFSEKIVYLPNCYQVNDSKRKISDKQFSRSDCGLPEEGFVFCGFNSSYKITPDVWGLWMNILKNVSRSVLWLSYRNDQTSTNLLNEARARGVDSSRIIFAPRFKNVGEHLARLQYADLFLDTYPYNAHSTASAALWAGLPVLTKSGESFASRVAGSLLSACQLAELIVRTDV
jgi:predicted O-linked N-acetylglucosamine transferase (SPINDLY family)